MKIILIALVIFFPLFLLWRLILKHLTDKAEFQKAENKIVGSATINEIEEIEFLLKYFKAHYPPHWRTQIKEKILDERWKELRDKYPIKNEG